MKYRVVERQYLSKMCFVCGVNNEAGTKAEFFVCENVGAHDCAQHDCAQPEKVLLTVVQPREVHQSYPDRMHGGVISALLDESIGRAMQIHNPDLWAVTIDLQVKFRKAVPLDQTIYIESRVTSIGKRAFESEGKMFLGDGTVCATATGKFFIVPVEKTFMGDNKAEDYLVISEEAVPEYIITNNE